MEGRSRMLEHLKSELARVEADIARMLPRAATPMNARWCSLISRRAYLRTAIKQL